MLRWADGERRVDIRAKLACNDAFVTRRTKAFELHCLAGLVSLHSGRAPVWPVAKLEAAGAQQGVQAQAEGWLHALKQRQARGRTGGRVVLCRAACLAQARTAGASAGTAPGLYDPDFENKAADVIGLYLNPPTHAVLFCVDEEMAIKALYRKDCMLSLAPGIAESHGYGALLEIDAGGRRVNLIHQLVDCLTLQRVIASRTWRVSFLSLGPEIHEFIYNSRFSRARSLGSGQRTR